MGSPRGSSHSGRLGYSQEEEGRGWSDGERGSEMGGRGAGWASGDQLNGLGKNWPRGVCDGVLLLLLPSLELKCAFLWSILSTVLAVDGIGSPSRARARRMADGRWWWYCGGTVVH